LRAGRVQAVCSTALTVIAPGKLNSLKPSDVLWRAGWYVGKPVQ